MNKEKCRFFPASMRTKLTTAAVDQADKGWGGFGQALVI